MIFRYIYLTEFLFLVISIMTSMERETSPMMEEGTEEEYSDRFEGEEQELPTHQQQGNNVYRSGEVKV